MSFTVMINFAVVIIVVNRISFLISQASYSTPQLSPSNEVYSIPFNEETIILITVRNVGRKNFNITHITGYLHAAHSFDFLVENVSRILAHLMFQFCILILHKTRK